MKGKPPKPKRASYTRTIYIASGDTLEKVLANVESAGVKPSGATFRVRESDDYGCQCGGGYYSDDVEVTYQELESDEAWELRLATYRKCLASWEKWYSEHEGEIATLLAAKTEEKKEKLTRLAEKSLNSLKKERKTLEKRLENLKKRLQK